MIGRHPMLIKPAIVLPDVLRRAIDAYRANDPIAVAESFDLDARIVTEFDPLLAAQLGMEELAGPVHASSAIGILKFYAYELSTFDVKDLEVVSSIQSGRNVTAICNWKMRLHETGEDVIGTCRNTWILDSSGRRLAGARSVCGILTPSWPHNFH